MSTAYRTSPTVHVLPDAEPQPTDTEIAVVFRGDGEPKTARGMLHQLDAFETENGMALDSFTRGGTVEKLEQRFAAMLGKEAGSLHAHGHAGQSPGHASALRHQTARCRARAEPSL